MPSIYFKAIPRATTSGSLMIINHVSLPSLSQVNQIYASALGFIFSIDMINQEAATRNTSLCTVFLLYPVHDYYLCLLTCALPQIAEPPPLCQDCVCVPSALDAFSLNGKLRGSSVCEPVAHQTMLHIPCQTVQVCRLLLH